VAKVTKISAGKGQHRRSLAGYVFEALNLHDIAGSGGWRSRRSLPQETRGDRPSMPVVGDDRDRLLVIPDEHAANNLFLLGLKPDALADLKSSIWTWARICRIKRSL
jgi:hypothetical protein